MYSEPRAMADGLDDDVQDVNSDSDPADCWPVCENVLRSLSEDVRPTAMVDDFDDDDNAVAAVASNVLMCLAEPVRPAAVVEDRPPPPSQRITSDDATAAARRMQTRLMDVPSAYTDGNYYAPDAPYVSRTVEELCTWTAADVPANVHTYTAGTVDHDRNTGACHLHGLVDPRNRVAVDCSRLMATLPRHRSTVKMFATIRTRGDGDGVASPVLVVDHFQVFSCAALFR